MVPVDLTQILFTEYGTIKVWECSACGHTFEELNGLYPHCPFCLREIKEREESWKQL